MIKVRAAGGQHLHRRSNTAEAHVQSLCGRLRASAPRVHPPLFGGSHCGAALWPLLLLHCNGPRLFGLATCRAPPLPPPPPPQTFRGVCHALERTFLISLLQPAPEVMDLFDDVLLLTDGRVIYQ